MSETFTFTGTARQLAADEFIETAAGKLLASEATVVIESEGGSLLAFLSRDGFQETFGRDPLDPPAEEKKAPAKAKK